MKMRGRIAARWKQHWLHIVDAVVGVVGVVGVVDIGVVGVAAGMVQHPSVLGHSCMLDQAAHCWARWYASPWQVQDTAVEAAACEVEHRGAAAEAGLVAVSGCGHMTSCCLNICKYSGCRKVAPA